MPVKRSYASPRRQEQANQTRRAVLAAAATLFVDPGYAATPITAVAREAGVAVQTVYAIFGTKRNLLSALVDVTLAGDDQPVAMPDRPFVAAIEQLADPWAKLARFAEHLTEVNARLTPVLLALAGAASADADAAAIWRKNSAERHRGMTGFATHLAASGALRPGVDVTRAADVLWWAMDIRGYDALVGQRGWSARAYRDWFVRGVGAVLLVGPPPEPADG